MVLQGDNATLRCSSDSSSDQITWSRDGNIIATSCTSHSDLFISYAPSSTSCNVVVLARTFDDITGPYVCDDKTLPNALAMLIFLGKPSFRSALTC